MFLGYVLYAGGILEGWHNGCRHWGVGNDGRIGNPLSKTQCKGGDISQTRRIYFSNRRWTNQNPWTRSGPENIHLGTASTSSRRKWSFLWESEGSPLSPPQVSLPDAGEAINDFWSMSGSFIYRHHVEPRVKLYSPTEESFPIPLKYIDVSRTTRTNLDVMLERRIDVYWNIDWSRDLSDPWTGFTQFTLLDEKPPDGYLWSGGRLTKRQLTSRPDHLWPELWIKLGSNGKLREKQKWSDEKPKLDNVGKLRGIDFIDSVDKEFKETIRNARKKLETPMAPAMPCKTCMKSENGETRSKINDFKSNFACILEASESTKVRIKESVLNSHEDHIAGRGDNSLQHYNLVHKFIPIPQAMKIPGAKAAADKKWEKLEKIRRGTWQKSEVNQRWSMKQGRTAQKFIFPLWWTYVIWRMPNWRHSTKNTKVELCSEAILSD